MGNDRHIILWRETGDKVLEWKFHVAESLTEANNTVGNLKGRGVHQYRTYELGAALPNLSSEY